MEKTPHITETMSVHEAIVVDEIRSCIAACQLLLGIDTFTLAAIAGNAMGGIMACVDAKIEKEYNVEPDSPKKEPLKQTFLVNFDAEYNIHRSKHERQECNSKPEPKIV